MSDNKIISVRGITKKFDNLEVLKGIDLDIAKGEVVSIVGPSGAGKTTLLQIMGLLDTPTSGSVMIGGEDVTRLKQKQLAHVRNKKIGFVFQFHQLLPEFTARENIMLPALIGGKSKREAGRKADELLSLMGLKHRADHKPKELSGGENQRVAVARALINDPQVVLADEPSGSLDSQNKTELHQLFFDLRDKLGQTFVIVTHDEQLAQLTDRTIHLVDGLVNQDLAGTQPTEEEEPAAEPISKPSAEPYAESTEESSAEPLKEVFPFTQPQTTEQSNPM